MARALTRLALISMIRRFDELPTGRLTGLMMMAVSIALILAVLILAGCASKPEEPDWAKISVAVGQRINR